MHFHSIAFYSYLSYFPSSFLILSYFIASHLILSYLFTCYCHHHLPGSDLFIYFPQFSYYTTIVMSLSHKNVYSILVNICYNSLSTVHHYDTAGYYKLDLFDCKKNPEEKVNIKRNRILLLCCSFCAVKLYVCVRV